MAKDENNNVKVKVVKSNNEESQGTKRGIIFTNNIIYNQVIVSKIFFSEVSFI